MATKLEELIVTVRADIRDLEKKLDNVEKGAKKTSKGINKSFDPIGKGISKLKDSFGLLGGAITAIGVGALGSLVKGSLDAADRLGKLASNTGFSAEKLQELRFAASQTGVAQNDLDASLQRFNRRLAEAGAGNQAYANTYRQLGIDIKDSQGRIKDSGVILNEVADAVSKAGSESEQSRVLFNLFGDAGFRLVNLFKGGSAQLNAFALKARELGIVMDQSLLDNAAKANDAMDVLGKVISTNVTTAIAELAPQIAQLATSLTEVASKGFKAVFQIGEALGEGASDIVNWINGVKQAPPEIEAMVKHTDAATSSLKENKAALQAANQALKERAELQSKAQALVTSAGEGDPAKKAQNELDILTKAAEQKVEIDGNLQDAILLKRQEVDEAQAAARAAEYEELVERNELLKEIDEEKNAGEIQRNQEKINAILAQERSGSKLRLKVEAEREKKEREMRAQAYAATKAFFGGVMELSRGKSKELFEIAKGVAKATAIIDGVVAVQKAASAAPPPFNIPLIAKEALFAGMNVAKINATQFARGGEVPGFGTGDKVPALLEPKETIVDRSLTKQMREFFAGGVNAPAFAGAAPGNMRVEISLKDDLIDMIETRIIERNRLGTREGTF